MLKFSILVLAGLYSQASGLYFGRYDVLVRAVDDVGNGKTRNDTSGLIPAISTAMIGNGKKLVPDPAELASNFTETTGVKVPAFHIAEVVKDAAATLEKVVETTGKGTASATEIKAAPAETAAAKTEDATEIPENGERAGAGTDKPETTPTPSKSSVNAKVRAVRKSRQSRSLGVLDYDYDRHIKIQLPINTGIVGVEDPRWKPGDRHIPIKITRRYWDWRA